MKVLVTGASGFVGQALVKALKKQGYFVVGVGRTLVTSEADTFFCVPDFNAEHAWAKPLENCNVVIHLAARVHVMHDKSNDPLAEFRRVNVDGTLNLVKKAQLAGVKRFIYISSIGVHGEKSEQPLIENDAIHPHNAYTVSKWEAEQALVKFMKTGAIEIVIIRPPLVYGANAPGNFAILLRAINSSIPLPLGAIQNKRSFVYVENLVSLIEKCIYHPSAANQVFLVSDDHDLSTTELLKCCADALNVKHMLWPVPQKLIEIVASLLGKKDIVQRLCGSLQVNNTKAWQLLDWKPPYNVEEGLKKTALAFLKNAKK